ncbi:hypothetical protein H4219_000554 [Mycoemilia scoparia]|uniref:Major facilitator superfamily (MFS) profile domain-containing protein n=1 Tax=Mycoemilia scoparia TaxID=417184 RepID=A0A9W8DX50_9FUNG|nr:hypothetical protein H4219_000554 [Mycoemilia scoparia]
MSGSGVQNGSGNRNNNTNNSRDSSSNRQGLLSSVAQNSVLFAPLRSRTINNVIDSVLHPQNVRALASNHGPRLSESSEISSTTTLPTSPSQNSGSQRRPRALEERLSTSTLSSNSYSGRSAGSGSSSSSSSGSSSGGGGGGGGGSNSRSSTPQDSSNAVGISKWRMYLVMVALFLGCFLESLDQSVVSTALPRISSDFNSLSQSNWVPTSYLLTLAAFQPVYGKLSDIFGRRIVFLAALAIFIIGSILCGAAQNMTWLIIARGLAGVGGAGIPSITMVIISDMVPLKNRAKYFSIISVILTVSSVAGPMIGGAFTDNVSWRWCFYFNIPTGIVSFLIVLFLLKLPKQNKGKWIDNLKRIDFWGVLIFLTMMLLLLLALNWGGREFPWDSAIVIAFLTIAGYLLIVFILFENRIPSEPIIPMTLFKKRNVSIMLLIFCFSGMAFFSFLFFMPMYFTLVENASATRAGVYLIPLLVPLAISSIAIGLIVSKWGLKRVYVCASIALTTIGCGLAALYDRNTSLAMQLGCLVLPGIGVGLILPLSTLGVQLSVKPRFMAVATTFAMFMFTLGGILGLTINGAILDQVFQSNIQPVIDQNPDYADTARNARNDATLVWSSDLPTDVRNQIIDAFVDSIRILYLVLVPICGVGFILSLFLKKFHKFSHDTPVATPTVTPRSYNNDTIRDGGGGDSDSDDDYPEVTARASPGPTRV